MNILSIETSCDETAAAVTEYNDGFTSILSNAVSSQTALHTQWGGVVPQLASREHIKNIVPIVHEALKKAGISHENIDLLAVTAGPGLMPALVVGVTAAKTLSFIWNKPLIGIQHLEGHIYANFIGEKSGKLKVKSAEQEVKFPLIALVVSGAHTQLVLMRGHLQYEILGETQDDAVGEAFDKVARMLGLPYPGGPEISRRADTLREQQTPENLKEFTEKFPRPMLGADNYNFSFSGLKTAVLYSLKKENPETLKNENFIASMCHAFQEAAVDVLVGKTKKALSLYSPATFVIAGGVSANVRLRTELRNLIDTEFPDTQFLTPEFTYSLDNAAMIGIAAAYRYERMSDTDRLSLLQSYRTLEPNANMPFQNLV